METHNSLVHPSEFIIYSGEQGVRATVLGGMRGHDIAVIGNRRNFYHYSLNANILEEVAVLHFALAPFCSWGCANSACRLFDTTVLMSNSRRLLILHSPQML
jgi:hypothetical protein